MSELVHQVLEVLETSVKHVSASNKMAAGMERLKQIEDNIEHDTINLEKYIKESAVAVKEMFRVTGARRSVHNLRAVNGAKSVLRQWHLKFTTALGQIRNSYEEIAHRLVKEIDLGKEMDKITTGLRVDYGEEMSLRRLPEACGTS